MKQSRKMSLVESLANTASGFVISWMIGLLVYPWFGFAVTSAQGFLLTCIFTVVSVARSYVWRRAFEHWRSA